MSTTPVIRNLTNSSKDSQNYMSNFQNILEPGHVPCMTKEWKPKVAQQMERYLSPDELKQHVLNKPKIQLLLEYYANKSKTSVKDLEKEAREILEEIGLGRNLPIIRWCGMCITAIAKRISTGIYVNEASMQRVKDSLGSYPVLYLPSHRSYCDFILMSYICFKYDIEIPGIAAGMDFYSMICMGNMLRKTGAFFMRRSFTGDDLYWDIFREYVHSLVTVYHTGIEFFIEGTRSRNFKAIVPKIGLLSMALEPLFMGEVSDIIIVPVSVSYDRLMEEQLFVYELLGVPKPKESTKGFFKALKIIEQKFGRMYVDFGPPISAKEYFSDEIVKIRHSNIPPYLQKLEKHELDAIKTMAMDIVFEQQRRIVITTFNLIAVYYTYRMFLGQNISLEQLCNGVLLLKTVFEKLGALIATEERSVKMDIIETLEIHSNILMLPPGSANIELVRPMIQKNSIDSKKMKAHKLNETTMYYSIPNLSLQLYINPCMFWLAKPSLMVLCATRLANESNGEIQKDQLRISVDELYSYFANEFVLYANRPDEDFYSVFKHLVNFKIFEVTDRIRFRRNEVSDILLSTVAPFLFGYFQVLETIILNFSAVEFTEKDLLVVTQERMEQLLLTRTPFTHSICFSLECISSALTSFAQNDIVNKRKQNVVYYSIKNEEVTRLKNKLLHYCNVLPFTICSNIQAKL